MSERKRPPKDWEGAVNRIIREAMERGEFQNLPGRGRRLDLSDNPFTPRDLRLAYKLLKDGGISPGWIEDGKEIAVEIQELTGMIDREVLAWIKRPVQRDSLKLDKIVTEHQYFLDRRERFCKKFRERAESLNQRIEIYNLKVPLGQLQLRHVNIESEIERFLSNLTK